MILTELVLENYGLYRGRTVFDLRPRLKYGKSRPIILFGGMNGAGKTTVLQAINLCLYGSMTFNGRLSQQQYYQYLMSRVHRAPSALIQPDGALIELEFEQSHVGENNVYRIRRSWLASGRASGENLEIFCNGKPLDNISADHWQEFIKELVPPGISRLFFFDGERIQELAEDSTAEEGLRTSILGLLGLDIVDTLRADLQFYLSRKRRESADAGSRNQLQSLLDERQKIDACLSEQKRNIAELQGKFENAVAQQQKAEEVLRTQGGQLAEQWGGLTETATRSSAKIEDLEIQARDLCNGVLPFALAPKLLASLRAQLVSEGESKRYGLAIELLDHEAEAVLKEIQTGKKRKELPSPEDSKAVFGLLRERLELRSRKGVDIRHDLSPADERKLISWIDEALETVPQKAAELGRQLEKVHREHTGASKKLQAIPLKDQLDPSTKRVVELSQLVGELQNQLQNATEEKEKTERELLDIDRQIRRFEEKLNTSDDTALRVSRAERSLVALEKFRLELLESKLGDLEQAFNQAYGKLARKEDIIRGIRIERTSLSVMLLDRHGREVPKSQLSAGEKQIYAIAMLWALADSSGRPLPVVVDTPLGRLDGAHRRHLIERYFPFASHQVIVLSTDTEVDERLFTALSPHVSHAFHLTFDNSDERTVATEGYFWKTKEYQEALNAAQ